jgi:phospholipase D1/2
MGEDAVQSIYGMSGDVILFWAHHEKLCLIDGKIAFMGGLDLCFGRWDTNQHPISDVHPTDLNATVFPGQDYNNARIMDFSNVVHPDLNQLDRRQFSRMGWSDISVSLQGPCVEDLRRHFVDRWNFIFDEKYNVRKDVRYSRLSLARPVWGQQPVPLPTSQQNPPQTGSYGQPGQQTQTGAYSQPGQQSQLQPPNQQPSYGTPGSSNNSRPSSSYGTNPPQFLPPPGGQVTQQPSWQGSAPPQANVPAYQQLQQQNTYGLPVPEWQGTSQSQSPHPPQAQPSAQFSAPGPFQSGQHYPPPPPGPPPVSSPPAIQYGQQAPSYGYVSPAYQPSSAAELEGSGPQAYQPYTNNPPAGQTFSPPPAQGTRGIGDHPDNEAQDFESERAFSGKTSRYRDEGRKLGTELTGIASLVSGRLEHGVQNVQGKLMGGTDQYGRPLAQPRGVMRCQIVRSCAKWSNGTPLEHSIQNAYISVIQNSQHFVYIENQFFITATGDQQSPVKNLVGKALVDRILRAARAGEKYKVIVVIPSVPGFADDLRDDSALGTRAIMEFQYNSINRGGHSVMQLIGQAGFNPLDYIRFYNLRNYDRINASATLAQAERRSRVNYEDARKEHDDAMDAPYGTNPNVGSNISPPPGQPYQAATTNPPAGQQYQQYQQAAQGVAASKPGSGRWDSVSECYMLGGEDIRNVPWDLPGELSEIDAFVSEELYIHSKVGSYLTGT